MAERKSEVQESTEELAGRVGQLAGELSEEFGKHDWQAGALLNRHVPALAAARLRGQVNEFFVNLGRLARFKDEGTSAEIIEKGITLSDDELRIIRGLEGKGFDISYGGVSK